MLSEGQSTQVWFENKVLKSFDRKSIKISLWYTFIVKLFYNTIATCERNPFSIVFFIATVVLTLIVQKVFFFDQTELELLQFLKKQILIKKNKLKQNFCHNDLCRFQDFQFQIGILVISITQTSNVKLNGTSDQVIFLVICLISIISTFITFLISLGILYRYLKNKYEQNKKENQSQNFDDSDIDASYSDYNNTYGEQENQTDKLEEDEDLKECYFKLNPVNQYMAQQRQDLAELLNQQKVLKLDGILSLNKTEEIFVDLFEKLNKNYNEILEKGRDQLYRQADKNNTNLSKQFSEFEKKSFFIEDSILNLIDLYLEVSKSIVSIKKKSMYLKSQISKQLLGKLNQNKKYL